MLVTSVLRGEFHTMAHGRSRGKGASRILLATSDVSPARSFAVFARDLIENGCEVLVVSGWTALPVFEVALLEPHLLGPSGPGAPDVDLESMTREAGNLVNSWKPDAIIFGVSRLQVSVDLAFARLPRDNIPSIRAIFFPSALPGATQDLSNCDVVLAADHVTAKWAQDLHRMPTHTIGSASQTAFSSIDVEQVRGTARAYFGLDPDATLVCFCAQTSALGGLIPTYRTFIAELARHAGRNTHLMVRPHPADLDLGIRFAQEASDAGIPSIRGDEVSLEDCLCGADLLVSCNSTIVEDFWALRMMGRAAFSVPLHLMFDPTVIDWMERNRPGWVNVSEHLGHVHVVRQVGELREILAGPGRHPGLMRQPSKVNLVPASFGSLLLEAISKAQASMVR